MRLFSAVLIVVCGLAGRSVAGPVTLVQGGWTYGGPLTVWFDGTDGNLDGALDQSELTDFEAVYLLPLGGSTAWGLGDLQPNGFLFENPGDYLFFATNLDYTLVDSAFQGLVSASIADAFLFPVDLTEEVPTVVPEPGGMAVWGVIVLAASFEIRRRRSGGGQQSLPGRSTDL